MIKQPTDEQNAIFERISKGNDDIIIGALAGCGKTSTVLESLRYVPQKSALFCAFNKPIADELTAKLPKPPKGSFWKAQTFHSLGLKVVSSHTRLPVKKYEATEELINGAAQQLCRDDPKFAVPFRVRRASSRLLVKLKEICVDREVSIEKVTRVGYENDAFPQLAPGEVLAASKVVQLAYALGLDLDRRFSIDFCDMTWLPVALNLAPPMRYQAVFVDECQDLSLVQLALVKMMVAPGGRLIMVGDPNQQIYSWRGSVGEQVWAEMRERGAIELPLTQTFRCDGAIVKSANALVPALRVRPGAGKGVEREIQFKALPAQLAAEQKATTFVLSRNNADLLHTAMYLWRSRVSFELRADDDIVEPLFEIIDKLDRRSKDHFRVGLVAWQKAELARAESAHSAAYADRVDQHYAMLLMMLDYAEPHAFKNVLQSILKGVMSNVLLSSVHKVKGLEADRVFLLKQTFARHRLRGQLDAALKSGEQWQIDRARERLAQIPREELNLEYVAITRAKHELVWVDIAESASYLVRVAAMSDGEIVQTLDGGLALERDGDSVRVDPKDLSAARLAEAELACSDNDEGGES